MRSINIETSHSLNVGKLVTVKNTKKNTVKIILYGEHLSRKNTLLMDLADIYSVRNKSNIMKVGIYSIAKLKDSIRVYSYISKKTETLNALKFKKFLQSKHNIVPDKKLQWVAKNTKNEFDSFMSEINNIKSQAEKVEKVEFKEELLVSQLTKLQPELVEADFCERKLI